MCNSHVWLAFVATPQKFRMACITILQISSNLDENPLSIRECRIVIRYFTSANLEAIRAIREVLGSIER